MTPPKENRRLALLGASGHGKVIADAALASQWKDIVFFDDAWPTVTSNGPWQVAGSRAMLLEQLGEFDGVIVAIGNCLIRAKRHRELSAEGALMATIIHPHAYVSPYSTIGAGTVVMAGAVINAGASISDASIINTSASVDHDCQLGFGVHISPGAHLAGNVTVGANAWVGIGAVVRQGLSIGTGTTVGAGAVVVKSVESGVTVVGNPATPLKTN